MGATWHRYWGLIAGVALGLGIGGAAGFYVRALNAPSNHSARVNLFLFAAPRLAALQLGGFLILEVAERTLLGAGMAHRLEETAVIVGLVLQVVVAVVSALVLAAVAKLVTLIVRWLGARKRAPKTLPLFGLCRALRPSLVMLGGGSGARGPP